MVRRNFLQVLQEKNVDLKREYQRLYELFYIQSSRYAGDLLHTERFL